MIPANTRVFVYTKPIDMRKGFHGLAAAAKEVIEEDPESGSLFAFVSRDATRLKILWWDRTGYCLLYKRLEWGVFKIPAAVGQTASVVIDVRELAKIIEGIGLPPKNHRMYKEVANAAVRAFTNGKTASTSSV